MMRPNRTLSEVIDKTYDTKIIVNKSGQILISLSLSIATVSTANFVVGDDFGARFCFLNLNLLFKKILLKEKLGYWS